MKHGDSLRAISSKNRAARDETESDDESTVGATTSKRKRYPLMVISSKEEEALDGDGDSSSVDNIQQVVNRGICATFLHHLLMKSVLT